MTATPQDSASGAIRSVSEHIVSTPGVCGGKPRINGHRIKVQHIAIWHERMGQSADLIVQEHPELTLSDVYAALAYYFDHREEIDRDIREDREFADELRNRIASLADSARKQNAANDPVPSR